MQPMRRTVDAQNRVRMSQQSGEFQGRKQGFIFLTARRTRIQMAMYEGHHPSEVFARQGQLNISV
jgi:hypothetical protein